MTRNSFQGICPACSTIIANQLYHNGDIKCLWCENVISPKIARGLLNLFIKKNKREANEAISHWIEKHLPELSEIGFESKYMSISVSLCIKEENLFVLERESQIKTFVEEIVLMAKNFIESHPEIKNVNLEINELILLGMWIIGNPEIIEERAYSVEDRYYMPGRSIGHEITTPWHLDIGADNFLTSSIEEVTINDSTDGHQVCTTAYLTPKTLRELVVIVRQFNSNPEILFFAPTGITHY